MPTDRPTDREDELGEEVEQEEELSGHMSFFDHLEELRRRILNSLIAVGIGFVACYTFAEDIFWIFRRLIENAGGQLNQVSITEGFTTELKMAFMAAIFLTSPFLLAQVWLFISPGLYQRERKHALPFIFFSSILFVTGGLFGYFIALPFGIRFLLVDIGKEELGLTTILSVSEAFNLVFALEVGLGVVFLIPALIYLLSRLGLVTGSFLLRNTKYAVLACFILSALITPTGDIANMMIIAVPMITLYMLGVVIAFIFGKKRTKEA
jgi:sec-independent protein translocase protein TatC